MRFRDIVAGTLVLVAVAACGGSTPAGSVAPTAPAATSATAATATAVTAATGTPAATAVPPVVTQPPITEPPITQPPTSQQPGPTFAGDPDFAAAFPKTIDGQPVTNVTTARLIDFFRAFSAPEATIEGIRHGLASIGVDLETVVFGNATATFDGSPFQFQALRVPGKDANLLIQNYQALDLTTFNEGDTLKQETSGGKNVSVIRNVDGYASTWLYAHGEILWTVDTSDEAEAAAVFTALP
jgi:hypothetical protein